MKKIFLGVGFVVVAAIAALIVGSVEGDYKCVEYSTTVAPIWAGKTLVMIPEQTCSKWVNVKNRATSE